MSIALNEQERNSLASGQAVRVTDSDTNQQYVLLPVSVYERIRDLLYNDSLPTDEETARLGWEAGLSIGWDDPRMDEYNDYDSHRKSP